MICSFGARIIVFAVTRRRTVTALANYFTPLSFLHYTSLTYTHTYAYVFHVAGLCGRKRRHLCLNLDSRSARWVLRWFYFFCIFFFGIPFFRIIKDKGNV